MVPGNEHLKPHMLALNPRGTLPILVDGDLTLTDVTEILRHIGERYHLNGEHRLFDPWVDADTQTWLDFAASALAPARQARLAALFGLPGDAAALTQARKALRTLDDAMTHRRLAGSEWIAGSGPTLADIALFPSFALSRDYGLGHEEFPALRRWSRRVRRLPGFITMPGIPDYA
jgi:glutathione S-transferase